MTAIHESSPQHQTIQAHVVEEIMPEQLTEVTDVKEVINQLLPTRKRKPRTKKPGMHTFSYFNFYFFANFFFVIMLMYSFVCSFKNSHTRWYQYEYK